MLLLFSLKLVAAVILVDCMRCELGWGCMAPQSWMSNGHCRENLHGREYARGKGTFSSRVPVLSGGHFPTIHEITVRNGSIPGG